jgi:MFS family permease
MDEFALDVLGIYATPVFLTSLLAVILARRHIRKRHLLILLALTVLGFIGFFALVLWGFTWYHGQKTIVLYQAALRILAGITIGCGAAIGYTLTLNLLGLAPLDDPKVPSSQRRRR